MNCEKVGSTTNEFFFRKKAFGLPSVQVVAAVVVNFLENPF